MPECQTPDNDFECRRFQPGQLREMVQHGIGGFMWVKGIHPRMYLIIPCASVTPGWEVRSLDVDGWGFPGGHHTLVNGNLDRPTLQGSIPGHTWHGWLRDGRLTTTPPDP